VLPKCSVRTVSQGKIIHRDDHATLKVKTPPCRRSAETPRQNHRAAANPAPPDLVLNRHCAECEFQARCRKLAVEKDDLSLLAGMSARSARNSAAKASSPSRNFPTPFARDAGPGDSAKNARNIIMRFKALAIREQKIHIVGSPELKLAGTPIYLDVEGLPDRDFYYLIGLRIGNGDSAVQHSLWADTVSPGERNVVASTGQLTL